MKPVHLALLALIIILGVVNLLASLGVIGGGGKSSGSWEYLVLTAKNMDDVGFAAIAKDEGLKPNEKGEVPLKEFPPEKIIAQAMIPRTLQEVEKEGWEFVTTTSSTSVNTGVQGQGSRSERIFIFRRPSTK